MASDDYRQKLEERKAQLLLFLKNVQAQVTQAVGELNRIEGKLEAYEELTADLPGPNVVNEAEGYNRFTVKDDGPEKAA